MMEPNLHGRPALRRWHASAVAGLVAFVLFLGSTGNRWALDDEPIIAANPAAHEVGAAVDAFFSPYWPESSGSNAGQYRPFVILTYAVDWTLSGGNPAWFHLVNAALHALATVLVVVMIGVWLQPLGALVAGLVFAVHPVHVEAVANVVGRAELLVAVGLVSVVLMARAARHAGSRAGRLAWLGALGVTLLVTLFTKEQGVVAIALIALDHWADGWHGGRRTVPTYVLVAALTLGWLRLFGDVASEFVTLSEAATLEGLDLYGRLATMFPAYVEIFRLLFWPFDLAVDYNPQVLLRRTEWSWLATLGAVTTGAVVLLGVTARRVAPPIALGIGVAIVTYSPTSNVLFGSGIMLAERNLYLAVVAVGVVCGWLVDRPALRKRAAIAAAVVLTAWAAKSFSRVPVWEDTRTVVIEDFVAHSENYRAHLRLGSYFRAQGDRARALAHWLVAGELYPLDPFVAQRAVELALELGYPALAVAQAERAHRLVPDHPLVARWLVQSLLAAGDTARAFGVAQSAIDRAPFSRVAVTTYRDLTVAGNTEQWRRAVAQSLYHDVHGRAGAATRAMGAAATMALQGDMPANGCWDARRGAELAGRFAPATERGFRDIEARSRCQDR